MATLRNIPDYMVEHMEQTVPVAPVTRPTLYLREGHDIQQAINYLNMNGGGRIQLAEGTYHVDRTIHLNGGINIDGAPGHRSRILVNNNVDVAFTANVNGEMNNIDGIAFEGVKNYLYHEKDVDKNNESFNMVPKNNKMATWLLADNPDKL